MNFFSFHIGDYAVHTRHLSLMEDLAYRRLLDLYYTREKPLPADVAEVARLAGMRDQEEAVLCVLTEFFGQDEEGWFHERCDKEIARMQDKQIKAKASAQASVNARSANAQRPLKKRSATKTITNTKTISKEPPAAGESLFQRFYAAYPRKAAPLEAEKAFDKLDADEALLATMLRAIKAQGLRERVLAGESKFVPYPATWLNRGQWRDAPDDAGIDLGEWHETRTGVNAKARELGVEIDETIPFPQFRERVKQAMEAHA